MPVLGGWLRAWWRQGDGAGAGVVSCARGGGPAPALVLRAGCARGGDRVPVPVLGAGCAREGDCELAARVVETGCRRWLCAWWRQGAGAGCWCRALVAGAGLVLGAVSWQRAWWTQAAGTGCRCRMLAARVVEAHILLRA